MEERQRQLQEELAGQEERLGTANRFLAEKENNAAAKAYEKANADFSEASEVFNALSGELSELHAKEDEGTLTEEERNRMFEIEDTFDEEEEKFNELKAHVEDLQRALTEKAYQKALSDIEKAKPEYDQITQIRAEYQSRIDTIDS